MTVESGAPEPPETDAAVDSSGALARVDARMAALRSDESRRRRAFAVAVLGGLALAWVHWIGLVVAGALVGVTRRRLIGALGAGLAFGALAVSMTVVVAPAMSAGEFLALTPINYATAILGLVLPAWGSMIRYVI